MRRVSDAVDRGEVGEADLEEEIKEFVRKERRERKTRGRR